LKSPLLIVAAIAAVLGLLFLLLAVRAFRQKSWLGWFGRTVTALLFLSLAALFATISVSTQGYRALTHEELAATVTTQPTGPQSFHANFRFLDGRDASYDLMGDEIVVDAHILKWKPLANLIGLHTVYELDRVAGRYTSLEDEHTKPRTVFQLGRPKPIDLFNLARRYTFLALLVDAEYGSGTFTDSNRAGQFEVSVSISGLLIRRIGGAN
jgi:hypothetical protein